MTEVPWHDDTPHIAVIGMAGRFPGAADLAQYWQNLASGRETIVGHTREDLLAWGEHPALLDDPGYVTRRGSLERPGDFDAGLFGFHPREATITDPQHRLFLECSWEALEDAGYDPRRYPGSIGVYGSATPSSYLRVLREEQIRAAQGRVRSSLDAYQILIATLADHMVTRVSYKLGLTGPSIEIGATCAGSLVAVHQAVQALLGGECDLALAGGASVLVPPRGAVTREGSTLSPDGTVRAFDAAARGMVGGDGVGVVVLKRLPDAIADRDHIHAVIRGSAVNNLGSDRAGYTAPSVAGQARVVRAAQLVAEVSPDSITYVETHGTGTPVGDPIEVAALTQAFREGTDRTGYCAIGSVKTNIGHADAAAGIAGLIKVVLSMRYRAIPPSLNFDTPNPEIDFPSSPFTVATELTEWKTDGGPLRAGVSSFGLGGTNAHVVLEEPPPPPATARAPEHCLLVVTAHTPTALATLARNLAHWLDDRPDCPLADAAYTLQLGRQSLRFRSYAVCADPAAATAELQRIAAGPPTTPVPAGTEAVLTFPEQHGPAEPAPELYATMPPFSRCVDDCVAALGDRFGVDLRQVMIGEAAPPVGAPAERVLSFTIQYALAVLLADCGVRPAALVGSGVNRLIAECVAGSRALGDALTMVISGADPVAGENDDWSPEAPVVSTLDEAAALLEGAEWTYVELSSRTAGLATFLDTVGQLWSRGVPIDWARLPGNQMRSRVPLPTYPFERDRYLLELPSAVATGETGLPAQRPAAEAGGGGGEPAPGDGQGGEPAPGGEPSGSSIRAGLAALFTEVLGVTDIAAEDDFFDLGGDSLTAAQLAVRIEESLGIDVPPDILFDASTFAELVAVVTERAAETREVA